MTIALFLLAIAVAAGSVLVLQWWVSGGSSATAFDLPGDRSAIAFGFPEAKYGAMARLLDASEFRAITRSRAMPSDLMLRLQSGRRELVHCYLAELEQDFQRAQWLRAHAESTGFVASPTAVREMVAAWWRFRSIHRAARRKARRGDLSFDELAPVLTEVRTRFEKLVRV